eukprot:TRINITY_DN11600_c0_g1_i2.p1 TRINITY_DN11600_c0_g1~~TRINITY_DN11600_c0_g1_i2.p1  ORF type:complete len:274 (+),score=46.89 TRINITY_DN11600_c0_g1_i2:147-968(+)
MGGTFYMYSSGADAEPTLQIEMARTTIEQLDEPDRFCFSICKGKDELFTGSLGTPSERNDWVSALKDAESQQPCEPSSRPRIKKSNLSMRLRKSVASKAANSAAGKKIIKESVNEETSTLIIALKSLVEKSSGDKKKADELEKNMVKLVVKAYILVDNKSLRGSDFLAADKPLREAFNRLGRVFNGRFAGKASKKAICEALEKVASNLKQAQSIITDLMLPWIQTKNVYRLNSIFDTVGSYEFLERVFFDDKNEDDLQKLIDAMDTYTQFHYD